MITTNRIITIDLNWNFQPNRQIGLKQQVQSTEQRISVDWPCTWKFFRFRKLSVSSFSRLCRVFQSTESCLETLGFQVQSTEQSFQSTESCLGSFSALSKLFQNATGRTLALRVYANRQPGPICSSVHHQKHDQTSIKGFHTNLT